MPEDTPLAYAQEEKATRTFTVRQLISQLANCDDMDAEVAVSIRSSAPISVRDIDLDTETNGCVILTVAV